MTRHISEQYDTELDSARTLLLEMGGLVEQQLQQACQALYTHDVQLSRAVRKGDAKVNQMEVDIDDLCAHIIARRQPAATDLRTLISIMKASTDLERIGDEAGRIAKMAKKVANMEQPVNHYSDVRAMAELVQQMLAAALDAFARLSADGAVAVIESDDAVDDAHDAILREKGAEMKTQPEQIDRALTILWVARALERCGDHAKNVAEFVLYLIRGEDVRYMDVKEAVADD